MKKRGVSFRKTLQYLVLWAVGLALLFLAFRGQDFSDLREALGSIEWHWAFWVLLVTLLNHLSRAARWAMMLRPLQHRSTVRQSFLALMFGYLVHYVIPRGGEVARCFALRNQANVPVEHSFGTVVTERATDMLCFGVVTLLAFWLEFERISSFFITQLFTPIAARVAALDAVWIMSLLAGACVVLALFIALLFRLKRRYSERILTFAKGMWQGVTSVWYLRKKSIFLFHTVFIWFTYVLMTYLWFDALAATAHLGLGAGLAMTVVGSLGRLVPIQGGAMGAYHYLFQQGILLYGIGDPYGLVLALVIHGFQSVYYLVAGGLSTLYLLYRSTERSLFSV